MSKLFFYTNLDALTTQQVDIGRAYGLLDAEDNDFDPDNEQFNLTHTHAKQALADAHAYAVCGGVVFVQPSGGSSSLVNIILKPDPKQSFGDINPKVRFFVYRNIDVTTLADATEVVAPQNTLTYKIHQDHFNKTGDNHPLKRVLGFDFDSEAGTVNLESVFNKPTVGYSLFPVSGGDCIGKFGSSIDFEIVTDTILYHPDLAFSRLATNLLNLVPLTTSTQAAILSRKFEKEQILAFLDPAAFYGNFYGTKTNVYGRNSGDSFDAVTFEYEFSKKDIYTDILATFTNKNTVYIDIRNDFSYSYNSFLDYSDQLKFNFSGTSVLPDTLRDYYQKPSNQSWPLLLLNQSDLAPASADGAFMSLSLPVNDNQNPVLYFSYGEWKLSNRERSSGKSKRFYTPETEKTNFYMLDWIDLNYKTVEEISTSTLMPVSSYIKIYLYRRQEKSSVVVGNKIISPRKSTFADKVFQPDRVILPYDAATSLRVKTYDDDFYFDMREFFDLDYVGKIGIARDPNNVTLFAFASQVNKKGNSLKKVRPISIVSEEIPSGISFLTNVDQSYTSKRVNLEKNTLIVDVSTAVDRYRFQRKKFFGKITESEFDHEFLSIIINPTVYDDLVAGRANYVAGLPFLLNASYPLLSGIPQVQLFGAGTDPDRAYTQLALITCGYQDTSGNLSLETDYQADTYGFPLLNQNN